MKKLIFAVLVGMILSTLIVSALLVDAKSNVGADVNIYGNKNSDIKIKSEANSKSDHSILEIEGVDIKTNLKVNVSSNSQTNVKLSNGKGAEIKVMPSTASETAIARIRLNVCSEENNCTIEIKEVSSKNEVHAAYEIKARKEYKMFGLFRAKGDVTAYVDVETGKVIKINKPWWAVISTEVKGDTASQISSG